MEIFFQFFVLFSQYSNFDIRLNLAQNTVPSSVGTFKTGHSGGYIKTFCFKMLKIPKETLKSNFQKSLWLVVLVD